MVVKFDVLNQNIQATARGGEHKLLARKQSLITQDVFNSTTNEKSVLLQGNQITSVIRFASVMLFLWLKISQKMCQTVLRPLIRKNILENLHKMLIL